MPGGILAASLLGHCVCCPWLLSRLTSQPTDPLPHGLQVDPGGRESHRGRISSCLSVSNLSPLSSCSSRPSLLRIPPGTTIFLSSSQQSSLKESPIYTHYFYFPLFLPPPPTSWASPISTFLPPCCCSLVTQLISLLWGLI